jgi:hypothetical protein
VGIDDVTDLDWYLDNVVVPSGPEGHKVGPVRAWQGWWLALNRQLACAADDSPLGCAVRLALIQGFVLSRSDARQCGVADAATRRLLRQGRWQAVGRGWVAVLPSDALGGDAYLTPRRLHVLNAAAAATRRRDHVIAAASAAIAHGLPVLAAPPAPELAAPPDATTSGRLECAHVRRLRLRPARRKAGSARQSRLRYARSSMSRAPMPAAA